MPLRIVLAPNERLIVGDTVIWNSLSKIEFVIDGNGPVLRERDFLPEHLADTDIKRLYLLIQRMYLERNVMRYRDEFEHLLVRLAKPSDAEGIKVFLDQEAVYRALRAVRKMLHERGVALAA